MNEEIKEILDYLKIENGHCSSELSYEETHLLLDYITNLQQENERLEKQLEYLRSDEYLNQVKWERNFNETMNKELKTRIEKAVEYIKELISATKGTLNDMNYCDKKETITQYVESLEYDINHYEYLLNILNGRSDE